MYIGFNPRDVEHKKEVWKAEKFNICKRDLVCQQKYIQSKQFTVEAQTYIFSITFDGFIAFLNWARRSMRKFLFLLEIPAELAIPISVKRASTERL